MWDNSCRINPRIDNAFIRSNLECYVPAEPLYYSARYQSCCCHCGGTERLKVTKDAYPICKGSIDLKRTKLINKNGKCKQKSKKLLCRHVLPVVVLLSLVSVEYLKTNNFVTIWLLLLSLNLRHVFVFACQWVKLA